MRTLRKFYRQHFAEGCGPDEKLSDVLHKLDEPSLSKLVHDHEHGKLTEKVASAGTWGSESFSLPAICANEEIRPVTTASTQSRDRRIAPSSVSRVCPVSVLEAAGE